jgi:hypothetical protein
MGEWNFGKLESFVIKPTGNKETEVKPIISISSTKSWIPFYSKFELQLGEELKRSRKRKTHT